MGQNVRVSVFQTFGVLVPYDFIRKKRLMWLVQTETAIKQQENGILARKVITLPEQLEGFYCEAAAGSAEDVFADRARQWSGSETSVASIFLFRWNKEEEECGRSQTKLPPDAYIIHELTNAD